MISTVPLHAMPVPLHAVRMLSVDCRQFAQGSLTLSSCSGKHVYDCSDWHSVRLCASVNFQLDSIQCNAAQRSAAQRNATQRNATQHNTIQYSIVYFEHTAVEQNYISTTICTQHWDGWNGGGQKNNLIVVHLQRRLFVLESESESE